MEYLPRKKSWFMVAAAMLLIGLIQSGCGETIQSSQLGNGLSSVQEAARLEGADREQKLIQAAKQEGALTLYTSMALEDMQKLTAAFFLASGRCPSFRPAGKKVC